MSHYGLVGVLWTGLTTLWTSMPAPAHASMAAAGLGGEVLTQRVATNLAADVAMLAQRMAPTDIKLLLFWISHLNRLLRFFSEAAPSAWPALLRIVCSMHAQAAAVTAAAAAGDEQAAAVASEAAEKELMPRASRLLAWCLNAMEDDNDARAAVDSLRGALADPRPGNDRGIALLPAVLTLLRQADVMTPQTRHTCLPLLDAAVGSLAGPAFLPALESADLRREMAGSLLAFLAACCAAAVKPAEAAEDASSAGAQQQAQQTWVLCQQHLFRLAVQPHPLIGQVLGEAWADLVSASEEALARHHIMLLAELLNRAAGAEAGGAAAPAAAAAAAASAPPPPSPPSPLQLQLVGLLACLLSNVPAHFREVYFANSLVATDTHDSCKLAVLAAQLQLAALVDGGSKAGGGVCVAAAASAMQQLQGALEGGLETALHAMAAGAPAEAGEAAFWLAQLLEALRSGAAYFLAIEAPPPVQQLQGLAAAAVRLLVESQARAATCFAAAGLGLLRALHALSDALLPTEAQLEALLPPLTAWAGRPVLATAVAGLAAAYKTCDTPHSQLFHALLIRAEPLVAHAAMEAYADYSRGCPPANVRAAVPPALQDAGEPGPQGQQCVVSHCQIVV